MTGWGAILDGFDIIVREATLLAACGFLIGGIDDLAVDTVFLVRSLVARRGIHASHGALLADFPVGDAPGKIAIFVAAWDESAVIGQMIRHTLATFDYPNYALYVGVYPNDRATIDAAATAAIDDPRVRIVIGANDGPTTKADCLNSLWRALRREERDGEPIKAIVLHDSEDMVHRGELRVFDRLIGRYSVVQLPVMPLVDPRGRFVSGHYCDEFAEAHGKALVVRQALGAALPLAGVGCAIARAALGKLAERRGDAPFDADSLTEDYELGLYLGELGGRGVLARVREYRGGPLVAVHAYFPCDIGAAVRQKARWMTGIALAGWDRVGWSRWRNWREHWMRMRDRRAPLGVLILVTAYIALLGWGASLLLHAAIGRPAPAPSDAARLILWINGLLLAWRLAMRAVMTGSAYGWRGALASMPRLLVSNVIAMLAARRAMIRYVALLRGGAVSWEKTAHAFPEVGQTGIAA